MDASPAGLQVIIVLAITAVHFVFREATFERVAHRKNNLFFPPVYGLRAVFWLGIPMFLFAAYKVGNEIRSLIDWLYPLLFLGLASLIFATFPGTISLNQEGITFRRYPGLFEKRIKWDAVASVVSSKTACTIAVYAHDGTSIVHTQFHVDPTRFKAELKNRFRGSMFDQ